MAKEWKRNGGMTFNSHSHSSTEGGRQFPFHSLFGGISHSHSGMRMGMGMPFLHSQGRRPISGWRWGGVGGEVGWGQEGGRWEVGGLRCVGWEVGGLGCVGWGTEILGMCLM